MSHALVEDSTNNMSRPMLVSALDLSDLLSFGGEDSHERLYGVNANEGSPRNLVSLFFSSLPAWAPGAACSVETSHFFHDYDDSARAFLYEAEAKELCSQCKVQELCLKASLEIGDVYSICGGMTPLERAKKYPKAFNASINTHIRNTLSAKTSGRHIKRRPYRHNPSRETTANYVYVKPILDGSFFATGDQLSLFPVELDADMKQKSTTYCDRGDRFDFPGAFRQVLKLPRNSVLLKNVQTHL